MLCVDPVQNLGENFTLTMSTIDTRFDGFNKTRIVDICENGGDSVVQASMRMFFGAGVVVLGQYHMTLCVKNNRHRVSMQKLLLQPQGTQLLEAGLVRQNISHTTRKKPIVTQKLEAELSASGFNAEERNTDATPPLPPPSAPPSAPEQPAHNHYILPNDVSDEDIVAWLYATPNTIDGPQSAGGNEGGALSLSSPPPPWVAYSDAYGNVYYWNQDTGRSTWEWPGERQIVGQKARNTQIEETV